MFVCSRVRKAGLAVVAGLALAAVPALPASAHVSVSSADAAPGSSGTLVFRVPVESRTANTTALSIELPADTPFRSVSVGAVPGWTTELERVELDEPVDVGGFTLTEMVSRVTWTADGAGLTPGEFGEFKLRVGPFPDEGGAFAFPAAQTYSDGEVVAWADPVVEGEDEPDHPAPTLTVEAAAEDTATDGGSAAASDTTARVLAVIGIVVGAIGVLTSVVLARRRSPGGSDEHA